MQNAANRKKAINRGNEAMVANLKMQEEKERQESSRIKPLMKSRYQEKCRAQQVANLPTPPRFKKT